jgi:hypothetical protein
LQLVRKNAIAARQRGWRTVRSAASTHSQQGFSAGSDEVLYWSNLRATRSPSEISTPLPRLVHTAHSSPKGVVGNEVDEKACVTLAGRVHLNPWLAHSTLAGRCCHKHEREDERGDHRDGGDGAVVRVRVEQARAHARRARQPARAAATRTVIVRRWQCVARQRREHHKVRQHLPSSHSSSSRISWFVSLGQPFVRCRDEISIELFHLDELPLCRTYGAGTPCTSKQPLTSPHALHALLSAVVFMGQACVRSMGCAYGPPHACLPRQRRSELRGLRDSAPAPPTACWPRRRETRTRTTCPPKSKNQPLVRAAASTTHFQRD